MTLKLHFFFQKTAPEVCIQVQMYQKITIIELILKFEPFPKRQILDSSKLKEFADDNFNFN